MTYKEDEELGLGRVWVECDSSKKVDARTLLK